jgi:hypothetical protein
MLVGHGSQIERKPVGRRAEDRTYDQRHQAAQRDGEQRRDYCGSATHHHPRGNQTESASGRDQHRLENKPELGHTEVEFDLEHRHSDDDSAEREVLDRLQADAVAWRILTGCTAPLVVQIQRRQRRKPRSANHHQVGGTPQRHVLTEDSVPDVVEWEAKQRVQPAAGHQQATNGCVPIARDPHRGRTRLVVGQDAGQASGDEQQE